MTVVKWIAVMPCAVFWLAPITGVMTLQGVPRPFFERVAFLRDEGIAELERAAIEPARLIGPVVMSHYPESVTLCWFLESDRELGHSFCISDPRPVGITDRYPEKRFRGELASRAASGDARPFQDEGG